MFRSLAVLSACLLAHAAATAQDYPAKPVRMILTLGGSDFLARSVAGRMSESFGQPVIVDMVLGASGSIGAANVARAAPDGYTVLLTSSAQVVTRPLLSSNTPYDSVKSFTPIAKAAEAVAVVASNPGFPVAGMKELVEHAKRNPRKVAYATSGIGTTHHLSAEVVKQLTGVDWIHVPYKGSQLVTSDLLSGVVPVAFAALVNVVQHARAGKLRILAINNESRFRPFPDIPTVAEQLPGYERPEGFVAFFGPAGMPPPIVARLHGEIAKALAREDVRAKLEAIGMMVEVSTPEQLADTVKRTVAITSKMIQAAGIEKK